MATEILTSNASSLNSPKTRGWIHPTGWLQEILFYVNKLSGHTLVSKVNEITQTYLVEVLFLTTFSNFSSYPTRRGRIHSTGFWVGTCSYVEEIIGNKLLQIRYCWTGDIIRNKEWKFETYSSCKFPKFPKEAGMDPLNLLLSIYLVTWCRKKWNISKWFALEYVINLRKYYPHNSFKLIKFPNEEGMRPLNWLVLRSLFHMDTN